MRTISLIIITGWWLLLPFPQTTLAALQFQFTPEPGTPPEAIAGFEAAGQLWSEVLKDDVILNLNISFKELDPGILGSTGSEPHVVSYSEIRHALQNDALSSDDTQALNSLPGGSSIQLLINRTSNSPHGAGSPTPYVDNDGDANNTNLNLTRGNAKALGLLSGSDPGVDASIGFSTEFNWDFNPDDGITPNFMNFVYVAAHEIGHMLGFVSGVDILDINSPPHNGPFSEEQFVFVNSGDLFRFSLESLNHHPSVIDWTADTRPKYFSLDAGATDLARFSLGENFGDDGRQASHWKDNFGIGLMDPTSSPGEVHTITDKDKQYFDIIGWNLEGNVVTPTPTTPSTPIPICPPPTQGAIDAPEEKDVYPIDIPTAGSYRIETAGGTDTYLSLYADADRTNLLAENDDIQPGNIHSRIVQNLTPATYFVEVRHYSKTGLGSYTIQVFSEIAP